MRGVMFKKVLVTTLVFLLILGAITLSYWYGTTVGSSQTYMNQKAGEAALLASKLEYDSILINSEGPIERLEASERIKMEFEINRALIELGRVLEQRLPYNLFYSDTMGYTKGLLKNVADYRNDNPHIVDGIVYSPFQSGWREYMYTKDWEAAIFIDHTPEEIEKFRKEQIKVYEIQELYYFKALNYGSEKDSK